MVTNQKFALVCLVLVLCAVFSGQAFSSTVAVGNCTSLPNYATIQQALNGAPAGSVIQVCPGTYREQIKITQKVTLKGIVYANQERAVILPPVNGLVANANSVDSGNPIAAQILVQDTAGPVVISNLTVDGTGNLIAGCAPDLIGIMFQNASGTVSYTAVRNETLGAGLGGCQSGEGIFVQTGTGLTSAVTVLNSSVHNYNKNGITGNDIGTSLTVKGTYVQGSGVVPVPGAAQNGIQLGFGATGLLSLNTVVGNIYGDPNIAASADILLYDTAASSGISVASNTLGNSQLPIVLFADDGSGGGVSITSNKIFGTATYDAIDVCTSGNTVKTNTLYNSAESAVHLDASCGSTGSNNVVSGNIILESACAGILTDTGVTGNTTTGNTYYTVPYQVTSSTSRCTIPGLARSQSKTGYKFSPKK